MKELTVLLESLAEKLGTTTEYLWGVLINQAQIQVFINLVILLFMAVLTFFFYKYCKWLYKDFKKICQDDMEILPILLVAIFGIGFLVSLGIGIFELIPEMITAFYNPEYWALQEILKAI